MLSLYRSLSLRYWGRCRLRCGLVLLSIALGVATCVATSVLDANLETAFQRSATPLAGIADLYVSNGDAGVPRSLAEQLAQTPGVRMAQTRGHSARGLARPRRPAGPSPGNGP